MTQNPPLTAYYLALVGLLLGWSELALHTGFLPGAGGGLGDLPACNAVLRPSTGGGAGNGVRAGFSLMQHQCHV